MCSPGYRASNWQQYLSDWGTRSVNKGDTLEHRDECWNLAQQNVPTAVGIFFAYDYPPYCRAIDNPIKLMPWPKNYEWPSSFPDDQSNRKLCILRSHIENGNFKYIIILFKVPMEK